MVDVKFKERINNLIRFISQDLIEKDQAVRMALLTSVAGESIFFLGPPGTAKSMISRSIRKAFKGDDGKNLSYFEYLMNQFSTPDELFGPVSLKELENDKYVRIVNNYLPSAEVAFLDEIWKASAAIQNTLLTIINEKKFHNGNDVVDVPLKALIAASNELPASGMGLEALWDRFVVRMVVDPVSSEENFWKVVCPEDEKNNNVSANDVQLISLGELNAWQKNKIDQVEIPQNVRNVVNAIRKEIIVYNAGDIELNEENAEQSVNTNESESISDQNSETDMLYISDRRWKKIIHLMKTSAFLNGRDKVDIIDASIIAHCIWDNENQIKTVEDIVRRCISQEGIDCGVSVCDVENQLDNLVKEIYSNFYKLVDGCPKEYKLPNSSAKVYKLKKTMSVKDYYGNQLNIVYVGQKKMYDGSFHEIGNVDNYYLTMSSVGKSTKQISIGVMYGKSYKGDLELEPSYPEPNQEIFGNLSVYKNLTSAFDKKYKSIATEIDDLRKKVNRSYEDVMENMGSNLFADEQYVAAVTEKLFETLVAIDKTDEKLKVARQLYANVNFSYRTESEDDKNSKKNGNETMKDPNIVSVKRFF